MALEELSCEFPEIDCYRYDYSSVDNFKKSFTSHVELNKKVYKLENKKDFYKEGIKKDKEALLKIQTDTGLEEYAREKLFMKKEDEEIFIIEFDTVKD